MRAVIYALLGGFALGDWIAVRRRVRVAEYLCKPAVVAALVAVALNLHPVDPGQRRWFVVALLLSLAGDVFLMLPGDRFVPGLAAFLLAHVAFLVGFVVRGLHGAQVLAGLEVVALASGLLAPRILRDVPERERAPVAVYMGVISLMVAAAFGTGGVLAVLGAALFFSSDATLAWARFVSPDIDSRLFVMVTYHLGQLLLVASLAR
jgi:uncharacterized membrane protein YhhN